MFVPELVDIGEEPTRIDCDAGQPRSNAKSSSKSKNLSEKKN